MGAGRGRGPDASLSGLAHPARTRDTSRVTGGPGSPSLRAIAAATALVLAGCLPTTVRPSPSTVSPATPGLTASATGAPSPTRTPSPTASPGPTFLVHTVRPGDTLLGLGRRYGTSGRSIAYWNRDRYPTLDPDAPGYDPNRIEVGWTLRILPGEEYEPPDETPWPSVTPQPSLVIPPAPTPGSGTSVVVSSGGRGGNAVALTFDVGGRLDPALDILDWLIDHSIPATIFLTGRTATETDVGRQVLARVAAHPDLFVIGNHTWDHPDITTLGAAEIVDQLERTEAAIEAATGRGSKPLFRPPFGAHDRASRDAAGGAGWGYTVMWDVDTVDWKPVEDGGPTAQDITGRVLSRAEGGSIVLMHLGGYQTLEALPGIVEGLRRRGLEPVTLRRLLGVG